MDAFRDFFCCGKCQNKNFRAVFNFSISFHTVNFSDDLIYDRLVEEAYECTRCGMVYSKDQVEERLQEFKKARRSGI